MPRQPYSAAVPSTGGRLHPLPFWKGRGLGSGSRTLPQGRDRWGKYSTKGGYILSSLREERLGEKGGAFLKGKEGRVGFRKKLFFHNHFKSLEDKLDVIPEAGILYILQIELNLLLHDYMDVIILRISSLLH